MGISQLLWEVSSKKCNVFKELSVKKIGKQIWVKFVKRLLFTKCHACVPNKNQLIAVWTKTMWSRFQARSTIKHSCFCFPILEMRIVTSRISRIKLWKSDLSIFAGEVASERAILKVQRSILDGSVSWQTSWKRSTLLNHV